MRKLTAFLPALLLIAACGVNGSPGNGEKIGQIVKASKTGLFCDTFEAEIVRGGFNGGTGVNGAAFDFTVEDPAMAKQVEDAMREQREVIIRYNSEGVYSACRTSTGHFLVGLDTVKAKTDTVAKP